MANSSPHPRTTAHSWTPFKNGTPKKTTISFWTILWCAFSFGVSSGMFSSRKWAGRPTLSFESAQRLERVVGVGPVPVSLSAGTFSSRSGPGFCSEAGGRESPSGGLTPTGRLAASAASSSTGLPGKGAFAIETRGASLFIVWFLWRSVWPLGLSYGVPDTISGTTKDKRSAGGEKGGEAGKGKGLRRPAHI